MFPKTFCVSFPYFSGNKLLYKCLLEILENSSLHRAIFSSSLEIQKVLVIKRLMIYLAFRSVPHLLGDPVRVRRTPNRRGEIVVTDPSPVFELAQTKGSPVPAVSVRRFVGNLFYVLDHLSDVICKNYKPIALFFLIKGPYDNLVSLRASGARGPGSNPGGLIAAIERYGGVHEMRKRFNM